MSSNSEGKTLVCYKCGKEGHFRAGMSVGENGASARDPPHRQKDLRNAEEHGGASLAITAARRT